MAPDRPREEANTTYWEGVAATRWGSYITAIEKRAILKAHELSGEPTTALEIGCEGGRWSKLLADLGWNIVCTDIDQDALAICKRRIPTATCALSPPGEEEIPISNEAVNLLLCIEVPVIRSSWLINEAYRVLRDEGLFVGVFWNLFSYRGLISQAKAPITGSTDYYNTAYPRWRKRFSNRGFRFIHEEGYCWFPFRRKSNSPLVPFFTRMERGMGLHNLAAISPWIVFIAQKNPRNSS